MKRGATTAVSVIASILVFEASAHHSFNFFKSSEGGRFVTGEGTISEIRLVNPHSGVFLDVVDEEGDLQVWGFETRPAVYLLRRGWTQETLQIGQRVSFAAERLREPNRAWWRAMLVHGDTPDAEARLFIELEALDPLERDQFVARFEMFPPCESISELCYRMSREALEALQAEYGMDDFLLPAPASL